MKLSSRRIAAQINQPNPSALLGPIKVSNVTRPVSKLLRDLVREKKSPRNRASEENDKSVLLKGDEIPGQYFSLVRRFPCEFVRLFSIYRGAQMPGINIFPT